jgi:hypothetical protein
MAGVIVLLLSTPVPARSRGTVLVAVQDGVIALEAVDTAWPDGVRELTRGDRHRAPRSGAGGVGYMATANFDGTRDGASRQRDVVLRVLRVGDQAVPELHLDAVRTADGHERRHHVLPDAVDVLQQPRAPVRSHAYCQRGDYMPVKDKTHSTVLLAIEGERVWTLEGNSGTRVKIANRPILGYYESADGLEHVDTPTLN